MNKIAVVRPSGEGQMQGRGAFPMAGE